MAVALTSRRWRAEGLDSSGRRLVFPLDAFTHAEGVQVARARGMARLDTLALHITPAERERDRRAAVRAFTLSL